MNGIQSTGPSVSSFQALARTGDAVAFKGGTLQSTTLAKQGFFTRVLNWLRGESSTKINQNTKDAFTAAIGKGLSSKGLAHVLRQGGFDASSSKPLSSREVIDVSKARDSMLGDVQQLRALMRDMKPLMANIQRKEGFYAQKTEVCKQLPNSNNYQAQKAAGDEVRSARALATAQAQKIQMLVQQMRA